MTYDLEDIWKDDLLRRREDAEYLAAALPLLAKNYNKWGERGSYVLNLDAQWGFGKTFFMTRLVRHLKQIGHPAIYIDAWSEDYTNDPFTAVVAEIHQYIDELQEVDALDREVKKSFDAVKSRFGKIAMAAATGFVKTTTARYLGTAFLEAVSEIDSDDTKQIVTVAAENIATSVEKEYDAYAEAKIREFTLAKTSQVSFKSALADFIHALQAENGMVPPFYIVVDELDRCRPTYAIEMLERIKHLFDVPGLVFIIATNTKQLSHSVASVYGSQFDGQMYLSRFFSRTYMLSPPEMGHFVDALWSYLGVKQDVMVAHEFLPRPVDFVQHVVVESAFTLRESERFMDQFSSVTQGWSQKYPKLDYVVMASMIAAKMQGVDITSLETLKPYLDTTFSPVSELKLSRLVGAHRKFRICSYVEARLKQSLKDREGWFRDEMSSEGSDVQMHHDINLDEWKVLQEMHYREDGGFLNQYPRIIERAGLISI